MTAAKAAKVSSRSCSSIRAGRKRPRLPTFLQLRPGTDVVLFNGLLNHLRREDALDLRDFLDAHTEGFGAALRCAKSAASIPAVAAACGLKRTTCSSSIARSSERRRPVTAFSQGVNQSTSGTDKVNAIVNVHLATGRIGKPARHEAVLVDRPAERDGPGARWADSRTSWQRTWISARERRPRRALLGLAAVATKPGLKAVDLFAAVESGSIKAVWIMSTIPSSTRTRPARTTSARALRARRRLGLRARHRTTRCAHVLPAAAWGEKSGTVTNSERRISRQRTFLPLPGEAQPDWWIVAQVARRMGFGNAFDYDSPAAVFREHALSAFENGGERDFDIGAVARLSDADYDALQPFQWPRPAGVAEPPRLFADGRFFTAEPQAQLVRRRRARRAAQPSGDYPLVLNTGRVRDQWHDDTHREVAALSGHHAEPFVQLHPLDAARFGLTFGDLTEVATAVGSIVVQLEITDSVAPGQAFVPMHWGSIFASNARVCALIASAVDPISRQPSSSAHRHACAVTSRSGTASRCRGPARVAGHVLSRRVARGEVLALRAGR